MSRKVLTNYQFDVLQIIDDVIYVYFVAEMLIKMVSEGLIKSWNFQLLEPTHIIEKKSHFFKGGRPLSDLAFFNECLSIKDNLFL